MREMKDSGVAWIGEIPDSWSVSKLQYLGDYINGYAFKPEEWGDKGLPIIRIQDLTKSSENPNYFAGTIADKYLIKNGDILVSWAATLDAFIWNKGTGWLNQHIFKAVPFEDKITYSYFFWLIKVAMQFMNDDNKHGIMMQHVTLGVFNSFKVPLPDFTSQDILANKLASESSKVDSLIANQEVQIEKLKAYKQSLITEAVTKGLDPNVAMKDSGVEWFGEIPAHWKVQRGKAFLHETNERSTDGSEELLTVSHITGITPRSQKNVNMFMSETLEGYKICRIGDVASNTMWMWQGAIGVSEYHGVISPSYNTYRQRANQYNPKYLDYLLRIPSMVEAYTAYSTGITASRLRLYPQPFLSLPFVLPPIEEQECIVEKLNKECDYVDRLIAIKQAKIEKLNEYKKSLIYEYVTGKKEVAG